MTTMPQAKGKRVTDKDLLRELEEYRHGYYALLKCKTALESLDKELPSDWPDRCFEGEVSVHISCGTIEEMSDALEAAKKFRPLAAIAASKKSPRKGG